MELEGLPSSQEPATGPPESDGSNPRPVSLRSFEGLKLDIYPFVSSKKDDNGAMRKGSSSFPSSEAHPVAIMK
jgi:hypothetical protein